MFHENTFILLKKNLNVNFSHNLFIENAYVNLMFEEYIQNFLSNEVFLILVTSCFDRARANWNLKTTPTKSQFLNKVFKPFLFCRIGHSTLTYQFSPYCCNVYIPYLWKIWFKSKKYFYVKKINIRKFHILEMFDLWFDLDLLVIGQM